MSNKTQLQTNNTTLDALITRVNAAKDTAASLPESGGGSGIQYEIITIPEGATSATYTLPRITHAIGSITGQLFLDEDSGYNYCLSIDNSVLRYISYVDTSPIDGIRIEVDSIGISYSNGTMSWDDALKTEMRLLLVNDPSAVAISY